MAVRLDPTSGHAVLDAASATSEKAPPNDAAGPYRVLAYWLTIEDPVGTWFTLLTGSAATGLEEVSG